MVVDFARAGASEMEISEMVSRERRTEFILISCFSKIEI
jgi:hypothetical protein